MKNKREEAVERIAGGWRYLKKTRMARGLFNSVYEAGFSDGAASIDRVQVVREAFDAVKDRLSVCEGVDVAFWAMDAVLETIGEGE